MADQQTNSAAIVGDTRVESGMHETAETARDLARTLERGADAIDRAGETAGAVTEKVERVADRAASARNDFNRRVREHPLSAAGTALAIGFLLGRSRH
jgi:ElaB/YqjD/DUF883 family membrane-anchored ribosome-binding protein